jgi:hypothetical protein
MKGKNETKGVETKETLSRGASTQAMLSSEKQLGWLWQPSRKRGQRFSKKVRKSSNL